MSTINDLSTVSTVSSADKLPIWSTANGVTRGLPVSVLDSRYITQDQINLLQISPTPEIFSAGDGIVPNTFVPGTTFSLTLANLYGTGDNIDVFFDGTFQGSDQWRLTAFSLIFTSPIPVGTSKVYVKGGAARITNGLSNGSVTDASVAAGTKLFNRINDILDVKDFGAKGDGVTDDTAAITTGVAAAALVGADLFFPPGTYICNPTSPITATSPMGIRGSGKYSTIIKTTNLNAQIFSFGGQYVSLRDFQLQGPAGATSGILLQMNCIYDQVQRVAFIKYFIALKSTGIIGSYSDCEWNQPQSAASIGWQIDGYGGGLNVYNAFMYQPIIQPAAGIQVLSVGGMLGVNVNIVRNGTNFAVQPPNGKQVDSIQLANCFLDSAQFANLFIAPAAGGIVGRIYLTQVECSSSDANGMVIDGSLGVIDGVTIISAQANFCHANGIFITGANAKNIDIIGGSTVGNGASGLAIGANFVRVNNLVAAAGYGGGGNGATGIGFTAATIGVQLINCTVTGNGTPGIGGNIGGVQIVNCNGYASANAGTSSIASGGTSVVVAHGLSTTPVSASLLISPLSSTGSTPLFVDPASITSTSFTVRTPSAAAALISFTWRATSNGVT